MKPSGFRTFVTRNGRYVLIAPALIYAIVFLLAPVTMVLLLSFNSGEALVFDPEGITLKSYQSIFSRPATYTILLNTFSMSLFAAIVTLIIAYPVAYYLAFKMTSFRLQGIILFLLIIPYWIDWSIRSISWFSILGGDGLINYILLSTGLINTPITDLLFNRWTLAIIWVQTNLLFMIFPIYLSLILVSPELVNVARTLGGSPAKVFYHVTFKLSLPGVIVGVIFVFVATLGDYVTPGLWAGGLQTLGLTVQQHSWLFRWPLAGAYATLMLAITLVILFLMLRFVNIKRVFYK